MEDKITPFSNGTEFMVWRDENCDRCKKANLEAVERDKTCPMEYDTSFASVTRSFTRSFISSFISCGSGIFLSLISEIGIRVLKR